MTPRVQIAVGAASLALIAALLWPAFRAGEPALSVLLGGFVASGAAVLLLAARSRRRAFRYALLGLIPGFLAGGVGVWAIVRVASGGADGWEDLVAIAAGLLGAFAGSLVGAVVGGLWGALRDRRVQG